MRDKSAIFDAVTAPPLKSAVTMPPFGILAPVTAPVSILLVHNLAADFLTLPNIKTILGAPVVITILSWNLSGYTRLVTDSSIKKHLPIR